MSEARITQDIDENSPLLQSLAEEHNDFDDDQPLHTTEGKVPKSGHTDLHLAVGMGMEELTSLLIRGADIECKNALGQTPLHIAVEKDNNTLIQFLFDHGADVEARDADFQTPLQIAAFNGYGMAVLLLLEHGANVDATDKSGHTPLHIAAEKGYEDLVRLFLNHDAAIEVKDSNLRTPLHLAAFSRIGARNIAVVLLLLQHGANVDTTDKYGYTLLHIAAEKGDEDLVRLLLKHGAAIEVKDSYLWTPLHLAAFSGNVTVVSLLISYGANVIATDKYGRTPLHIAAEKGYEGSVQLLLIHGAAIEVKDSNLRTPLHLAAFSGNVTVISLLISYGANVEATDKDGRTPLHLATQCGFQEVLTILLESEADPNKADSEGCTALHIAADRSHLKVMRTLLSHRVDVNRNDKNGWKAQYNAANHNYLESTKTLLAFGANVNAINHEGYTALYLAVFSGYADIVSFLLDSGATMGGGPEVMIPELAKIAAKTGHTDIVKMVLGYQIDTKQSYKYRHDNLHTAVTLGYLDIVSLLLQDGNVDLENLDENGMTPLFSAADYPEMIALLVDRNANTNARCPQRDNITVLHHYVQLGKIKAVNILLNCGCNVEPSDDNGNTPLHYAVSKNNSAAVELLIHRGINTDIRNKYGSTAFYTAVECDNLKLVELLIDCDINIDAATYRISMTPLQCAIQRNNVSIIQLLLHHNVNVNVKGVNEDSPLHTAVRTGKDDIVSLLLRQDVDVNALNSSGHTPLDLALLDNDIVISQLLTKAGAELGEDVAQHLCPRRFQSSHGNAPSLEEGSQEQIDTWLKWVPGDGILNFENVNYSDTHRLSAIPNEYIQGLSLFRESIFQDNQDRYNEDQSFTHARSDTAVDTATGYFNPTLDRVTSKWASKVIEYLIEWCGVTLFYNKSLFVLKLNSEPDGPSPSWMSQFNKMSIIRESELLVVPRSKETMLFSIPGWYDHDHVLIQFINAVYVCRMASLKVSSQAFSEVLGCVEEDISDPLRGTLIAGLAILGLRGGDYFADKLVTAILSVYAIPVDTTQLTRSKTQRVLHERTCNCGSSHEHRPLSPIAAAKSVGILVWHPRDEKRILPRVWDLYTDTLVKDIDVRHVYFITHRWCENEIEYKDIMERSAHEGRDPAEMIGISTFSTKLERIRSVIVRHARYVWIDTICMDRSNLLEWDTAIHSMYKWYRNCFAVVLESGTPLKIWKNRGWCLQEGAAAGLIYGILEKDSKEEFVSMQELAHAQKERLCELDLSLYYRPGNATEILARMDARRTTRVEDMSYALIGIFSIHIHLSYGEQWDARTKVLRELATKKGDLSILSFATTKENSGKFLPLLNEKTFLVAECAPAKTPITFNRLGVTVEAQLVSIVEFQSTLNVLKRWMKLHMNRTKSVGLDQLISAAEQMDVRNSKYIDPQDDPLEFLWSEPEDDDEDNDQYDDETETASANGIFDSATEIFGADVIENDWSGIQVAIVHSIRSLMLVEIHDDEQHMDGSQAYISCHRLQCCQFEHQEFERLFADINVSQQTIFIKEENVEVIEDNDDEEQPLTIVSLNENARPETPSFSDDDAPDTDSQEYVFHISLARYPELLLPSRLQMARALLAEHQPAKKSERSLHHRRSRASHLLISWDDLINPIIQSASLLAAANDPSLYLSDVISAVRYLLACSVAMANDAPLLDSFPELADHRRAVLSCLSHLVIQTRSQADLAKSANELIEVVKDYAAVARESGMGSPAQIGGEFKIDDNNISAALKVGTRERTIVEELEGHRINVFSLLDDITAHGTITFEKRAEILEMTRKAVEAVRAYLSVLEHDLGLETANIQVEPNMVSVVLSKEAIYSAATNLVTAVRVASSLYGASMEEQKEDNEHVQTSIERVRVAILDSLRAMRFLSDNSHDINVNDTNVNDTSARKRLEMSASLGRAQTLSYLSRKTTSLDVLKGQYLEDVERERARMKKSHQGQVYSSVGIRESVDNIRTSTIVKRSTKSTINRLLINSTNSGESSESKEDDYRTAKRNRSGHHTENRNDTDDNRNYHVLDLVSKNQYSLSDIVEIFTAIGAALNDHTVQRIEIRHAQHDNSYPSPVHLAATIFHYVMLNSGLAENIFTEAKEYMTSISYALFEVHRGNQNTVSRMSKSNYRLDDTLKDVLMSEETDIVNHGVEIINMPTLLAFLEVYCQPELREFRKEMRTCTDRVPLSIDHMTGHYSKHYSFTGLEDNHIKITAVLHDGDSILPTDIEHVNGERDFLLNKLDANGIVAIKMSTELVKEKKADVYMLAEKHERSYHCLLYCTLNPGAIALLNLLGSEKKEIVVAGNSDKLYPTKSHYKCYQCGAKNKLVNTLAHLDQVGNSIQPCLSQRYTSGGTCVRILYDPKLKDIKLSLNMSVSTNDLFIICLNKLLAAYNAKLDSPVVPKISYDDEFNMRDENDKFAWLTDDECKLITIKLCYTKKAVHIYPIQSCEYLNSIKKGESSRHTRWLAINVHFYKKALKDLASRENEAKDSLENRTKDLIGVTKTATKAVPFLDMGAAIEMAARKWKTKVDNSNKDAVAKLLRTIHSRLVEQATFSPTSMLLTYRHNSDLVKESMTGEYMRFIGPEDDFKGPLPPYYKFRVYQLALIGAKYTWVDNDMMSEISAQSIYQDDETMYVAFFDEEDEKGEDGKAKKNRIIQFSIAEATEDKNFGESMMTDDFVA